MARDNEDDGQWFIGVCTECQSDQPAGYMERTKWPEPPCKYCGGVTKVIPADNAAARKAMLAQINTSRGIYKPPGS